MKQIRVTSPFLDTTASNKRREVGEIFLAEEKRAANLVNGKFCEYVVDGAKKEEPQNGQKPDPKPSEPKKPVTTTKSERK